MSEEINEANAYKIFRQLEERKKRANPYTFYDKDELIDEILKQEDQLEDLQQKVEQLENIRKEAIEFILDGRYGEDDDLESISLYMPDLLDILNKGDNNGK